jgi:5-(carboxyamino)imidazole ribonucleotide synthase
MSVIPPGSVIGIIGGGQLGRMIAMAAARLGYRSHVFTDQSESSAAQVTDRSTVAAYDDLEALERFARTVDVVTIEFENLPVAGLEAIAPMVPVRPSAEVLRCCQDRLLEKRFLGGLGVPTAPYAPVDGAASLSAALETIGRPAVLKTRRMGYDGKGQVKIEPGADLEAVLAGFDCSAALLEGWVAFEREISVITARNAAGGIASYVPVENLHENHILARTIAPAPITADIAARAEAMAAAIASGLQLEGLVAIEMFQTEEGDLLVNELAPRPHNSGHWTIDACYVSQFEQLVRAITGLPLGSPERFADAEMDNLLGAAAMAWQHHLERPDARLHLYGKSPIRPGRKHGHVTRLRPKS